MSNPVDQEDQTPDESPVATAKPRKLMPVWLIALVAVLIAGGGFLVYRYVLADPSYAEGECAAVTGVDDTAKVDLVDCGDESATFKIATKKDADELGCPEGAYRELRNTDNLLCLMPNFAAGKCYEADDANQSFRVTGCESTEAIKITEVIEGSTDPTPCPGSNGLGYPEPPLVFCIQTPTAP
ncbi:LppU/SCO3897 family protein [Actinokineospora sp.]|uniref:LppU/SCO3897 family protein n=1 Tax=Actinokineospora sp. TaxID=1872133 RepID=UPI0040381714